MLASPKHSFYWIALFVLAVFIFSSNRAWVYHRVATDGSYVVHAYPKKLPFMWQYDADAMEFFQAAAHFPDFYKVSPALVGRPLLPMLSHGIGTMVFSVIEPLLPRRMEQFLFEGSGAGSQAAQTINTRDLENLSKRDFLRPFLVALIGFIIVKISFFVVAGWLMFRLVSYHTDEQTGLLSVALLVFSPYAINSIGTYHTYEFQILTPIVVLFLFQRLVIDYSHRRNFAFSVVVGLLMMGKANYAVYLAVLAYSGLFLLPRLVVYKGILLSITAHLIPWTAWTIFIEQNGMAIIGILSTPSPSVLAIHPADIIGRKLMGLSLPSDVSALGAHSQPGVDFISSVTQLQPSSFLKIIFFHLKDSFLVLTTPLAGLALIALVFYRKSVSAGVLRLSVLLVFFVWLQAFFSFTLGPKARTLFDLNLVIYGFAALSVVRLSAYLPTSRRKTVILGFVSIYMLAGFLTFLKLPWVHPMDQVSYQQGADDAGRFRQTNTEMSTNQYQGAEKVFTS